jgi:3-hydroxy-9,10-secoandrosta-1,3,5(10)-triene-9,17-dione monooxygenase reductase component
MPEGEGNPASPPLTAIPEETFREVFGHLPTGVTVITGNVDGAPCGLTVGTFASLSIDPPLVLFCPARSSSTWPRLSPTGRFCANVLAGDQGDVGARFARSGGDKFAGLDWMPSPSGCPVLEQAIAWVDCTVETVTEGGDHLIVVGRVEDLGIVRGVDPLLFFRGAYAAVTASAPAASGMEAL